jgi:hypothetical protein
MSQRSVEYLIGRLVTDEGLRRRFRREPGAVLREMEQHGMNLNPCEWKSLTALNPADLEQFADCIDPRLQKIEPEPCRD